MLYSDVIFLLYLVSHQTLPVSVIPTVDGDNVIFQVFINVS